MTKFVGILFPSVDLRSAFNDIPTGYTPTNPNDGSFCDFSKLECLDTPTPLSNGDTDTYFVYPPNHSTMDLTYEGKQKLHYCKPDWSNAQLYATTTDGFSMLTTPTTTTITELLPPLLSTIKMEPNTQPIGAGNSNRPTDLPFHLHLSQSKQSLIPSIVTCAVPTQPLTTATTTSTSLSDVHLSSQVKMEDSYTSTSSLTLTTTATPGSTTYDFPPISELPYQPNDLSNSELTDLSYSYNYCDRERQQHPLQRPINAQCNPKSYFSLTPSIPSCRIRQNSSNTSKQHAKQKPLVKAFACQYPNCIKRFARVDELKRHQRTHSDVRQFVCDTCAKGFTRSDHLMTHRRTHTGERPYPCFHCERRFARSDERNRHMKVHTRDRTRTTSGARKLQLNIAEAKIQFLNGCNQTAMVLSPTRPERILLQT